MAVMNGSLGKGRMEVTGGEGGSNERSGKTEWMMCHRTRVKLAFFSAGCNCGNPMVRRPVSIVQKISGVPWDRLLHCCFSCKQPTWLSVISLWTWARKTSHAMRFPDFQHLSPTPLGQSYFLILCTSSLFPEGSGLYKAARAPLSSDLCGRFSGAVLRKQWSSHRPFSSVSRQRSWRPCRLEWSPFPVTDPPHDPGKLVCGPQPPQLGIIVPVA